MHAVGLYGCRHQKAHGDRTAADGAPDGTQGPLLPQQLQRVALQQQAGVRFDDVDFGKHNHTRFVGLENDIANCYANSLLQVHHVKSPDSAACLLWCWSLSLINS